MISRSNNLLCVTAIVLSPLVGVIGSVIHAQAQAPSRSLIALAPATGEIPIDLKVDVLKVVPDDALGVVLLSDFEQTRDTVEAVLRKLKIPFDGSREYADFNDFLERLDGWDSKSTHALALAGDPNRPHPLIFIPVTDYTKFAKSLAAETTDGSPTKVSTFGEDSLMAEKAGFAVFTEPSAGVEYLQSVVDSKSSIAASCEPIRGWLAKQQIAGVVLSPSIQLACDEMLKGLKELEKELERAKDDEEKAKFVPIGQLARGVGVSIVEAARSELTHLTIGARVNEKTGLTFNGQAYFKPGGKFSEFVKASAPLPADCLRNLPDEQYVAAGAYKYPRESVKAFSDFMEKVLDEATKLEDLPFDAAHLKTTFAEGRKMVEQLEFIAQSQSVAGANMYDGVFAVYHVDDSALFLQRNKAGMKSLLAALEKFKDQLAGVKIGEKKIGEIEATTMSIDLIDVMKKFGAKGDAQQEMVMKSMFGGDGTFTFYLAAATKDKVVMSYSESGLKLVYDSAKSDAPGLADDVMIKKTAALLPSDVMMAGYFDIGGYLELIKKVMNTMMAAQGQGAFPIPIPPFPSSPPVGYTFKAASNTASLDLVVPMELMENTRDYVMQMQALIGAFAR